MVYQLLPMGYCRSTQNSGHQPLPRLVLFCYRIIGLKPVFEVERVIIGQRGVPHFTSRYQLRIVSRVSHNLPQEMPGDFVNACATLETLPLLDLFYLYDLTVIGTRYLTLRL